MQAERNSSLVSNGNANDEWHSRTIFLDQVPQDCSVQQPKGVYQDVRMLLKIWKG